ncbi:hypothetical protein ICW40_06865 [Actinotalea ferrariae]|uniref:hypothetical protein n=1 Tax=Actinotalea ferrariae TaxID=1386098 RepID=UPI001C8B7094|nr:hypothetical protein [Actinotalea ferrariae]MBX9244528.1 hypothetical protein [Actinotalea ferrariae]
MTTTPTEATMTEHGAGPAHDRSPHDDGPDDDAPLDPELVAQIVADQRARVRSAIDVEARVLFGAWGVAWLLGFGALWVAESQEAAPFGEGVALAVFGALLLAAGGVTAWHLTVRTRGVHGTSAVQGAMYGWTWFVTFLGVFALPQALERAGASGDVQTTVMTVVPALVVGALYMAGGAMWGDRTQFTLGAGIGVVTAVAALVGLPHMLGVMAVAGGGGMLLTAGVDAVRRRRGGGRA